MTAEPRDVNGHRAHQRVPLAVEVTLESDHNFYAGITDNISEGGIFVAMVNPLPTGTAVEFELNLVGSSAPYKIRGEVCWVRSDRMASEDMPAGCGIRWVEIADEAMKAIAKFTRSRDTIFYED